MISLGALAGWRSDPPPPRDPVRVREGCVGKIRFASYAAAEAGLGGLIRQQRHRPDQGVLMPYRCDRCGDYHLGHTT